MATDQATMNVLLVDPVGDLREVERSLRTDGTDAVVETIGEPAAAAGSDFDPDCAVVLDHTAEGVDGIEQLEAVRTFLPDVPIVLVVRDPDDGDIRAGLDAGAADVITAGPAVRMDEEFPVAVSRRLRDVAGAGDSFQSDGQQLDSLLEYLPHQVFIKDDRGRIAEASAAAAAEYGLSREQMIGLTDHELFSPSKADELWAQEKEIMETEEPIINEIEHFVDADGRDRWVSTTKAPRYDSDGNVVGIIGTTRDITEQQRQEEMLNALHAASRDLVAAETRREIAEVAVDIAKEVPDLPVVEVALADPGGLTPVANDHSDEDIAPIDAAEADADIEVVEPTEVDAEDETDPTLAERYGEWFRRAYETGRAQFIEDRPADGGELSVVEGEVGTDGEIDADPVAVTLPLGEHGVLGFASTSGTFSEFGIELASVLAANMEAALDRAAREEALRERERVLAQQNERLEEFASIVSHDLRNPLSVARGYLGQVDADGDIVEEIEWALDRMNRLTDELLTLARQGQIVGETETVSLSRSARDAWQAIDADGATLSIDGSGTVDADPTRLVELLENLFRNSVEHAHSPDSPVEITVGATAKGFYVADDGPGIPDDQKEAVFEQGYTNAEDGTGFGLYIVQTLADAHGWTVELTDAESGGARFEFAIEPSV
ncbi:PAS domain S-box-containing protein [Natronoarchaeum philippinense]|uniref:histidine kinase n=1 Tax=Natronoarchaeum philippinense TaxID=558529 RepID=A0A285P909_NATPI|nr:PAS domain-containing protein [Natronoarchaeum philippinense]SNZ17737.1 PAS domain S-box-containing protein [Natronoarchaeum philippinense]